MEAAWTGHGRLAAAMAGALSTVPVSTARVLMQFVVAVAVSVCCVSCVVCVLCVACVPLDVYNIYTLC